MPSFYRILASGALCALMATGAYAQGSADFDHDHQEATPQGGYVCGTLLFDDGGEREAIARTAQNNPELYQRMVAERGKSRRDARSLSSADEGVILGFWMRNRVTGQYDQIQALLVFSGRRTRIWVDVNDTTRVRKNTINALAKGLDSVTGSSSRNPAKGILENDEEVFGLPPLNRFDNPPSMIEDFLLTDIKDNYQGGNVLGFFSPWDQTDNDGSNKMNILYIDSKEGIGNQSSSAIIGVLSTLAHEYQHLIHHRTNKESEAFFNEGCSEVASTICGYKDRSNTGFLNNTNLPLLRWSNGDVYADLENDYQRAMTFTRYIYEQYGESFLTKLASAQEKGMDRMAEALTGIGSSATWQEALKGFMVANYVVRNYPDSRYVYNLTFSNSAAKITNNYAGDFPATGSVSLMQYGSIYNLYNFGTSPGGIKVKFEANGDYAAVAMLYRNNQLVEVRDLVSNQENTIGETIGYDKIVFGVANLGNSQTLKWTVSKIASGVEDEAAAGGLAFTEVSPNPATTAATIRFRTAETGPVRLDLFDVNGHLLRTLIDGERREAGEQVVRIDTDGLPANAYILRLNQGGRSTSRAFVVVR